MKLQNGYEISGAPNRAEYHKNDNGLYTIDIKEYICVKPDGKKYHSFIRIPNAKLPVDANEGTIELDLNDIKFFNADNESSSGTIFETICPDVVENY